MNDFTKSASLVLAAALVAFSSACSREPTSAAPASVSASPVKKTELVIYAATSTRDALQSLEAVYDRENDVDLIINFGSSGDLSKQIIAAAKADVFLSADEKEMDRVEQASLLAAGTRRNLLSNQLAVIEPADAPSIFTQPFQPQQLADARVKHLSLANVETVPAGRYAKAWLEKTGAWSSVADRVLPGVDVRAALGAVESGAAQAGIVYRTDVARSKKARVVFAVPTVEGPKITYPIAAIAGRPAEQQARRFEEFLCSSKAGAVFEEFGFVFTGARPSK